jgi:adenylate kinase
MKKQAVIIYGTPGSGKGTQANLLSWNQGFIHFDSGKKLRAILNDPQNRGKKLFDRERKLNEAGILNTPSWVLGIFKKETEKIAKANMSIVYSGSPRTMFEAFGERKVSGLLPLLQKLYGKNGVTFFFLKISPEAASGRNKIRRICAVCNNPVLGDTSTLVKCPMCLGELKTRVDDDPEKYKIRYNEYMTRTMPIVEALKSKGVKIVELNAEATPPEIYARIKAELGF